MKCRGCEANLIEGCEICSDCERDELVAQRDSFKEALESCLDRLECVDTDSEDPGFIETCKPVIANAKHVLTGGWVDHIKKPEPDTCIHNIRLDDPCAECAQL